MSPKGKGVMRITGIGSAGSFRLWAIGTKIGKPLAYSVDLSMISVIFPQFRIGIWLRLKKHRLA
jgi:hypothetical protein